VPQGRDGAGAAPCCGTGVVFRRDALVSIGGQAYGSVTEDYNTAMHLMSAGFASMYLNERLVFGMVPEDVQGGRPPPARRPARVSSGPGRWARRGASLLRAC
jgi:cellulose synthase/poly-beta-1,6-N-acetylglucosamine synthase-like glycosyltransferase